MKKLTALILCFTSCFAFANPITIPSVEKIFEERFKGITEPFYGCIYSLETYEEEDLYDTKIFLDNITVGNDNQQVQIKGIDQFKDLEYGDVNFPKIGDCFAFKPSGVLDKHSWTPENLYDGYADLYEQEYIVDTNITKAVLKDKLTLDEYFQDKIRYGKHWIELTGIVQSAEINVLDNFQTILVSKNGDGIIAIMKEHDWKGNEKVKKQLRSFKLGEVVTVYGYFAIEKPLNWGDSVFQMLAIIDKDDNSVTKTKTETEWNEKGQKVRQKNYKDGKLISETEYLYYKNGQKWSEANYKDGKADGKWTWWYENGQKESEENYKNSEWHGKWTWWYENGQIMWEATFKDGVCISGDC